MFLDKLFKRNQAPTPPVADQPVVTSAPVDPTPPPVQPELTPPVDQPPVEPVPESADPEQPEQPSQTPTPQV